MSDPVVPPAKLDRLAEQIVETLGRHWLQIDDPLRTWYRTREAEKLVMEVLQAAAPVVPAERPHPQDMGEATEYGDRICEWCNQQVPRRHRCVARTDHEDAEILRHSNIIEIAVRNQTGSVSDYMNHWEGRALKAEAQAASAADRVSALTSLPRYKVSDIDDMLLPNPQPDGDWVRWSDIAALLDPAERPEL